MTMIISSVIEGAAFRTQVEGCVIPETRSRDAAAETPEIRSVCKHNDTSDAQITVSS